MKRRGSNPDDLELELLILRNTTDDLLPRVFRGGFLVSLWAVFESGIKDVAEYVRVQLKQPFGLQDLRAGDFLSQTERFFSGALQINAFPDKTVRKHVELLKGFRNTLAHHDGNLLELPKPLLQQEGKVFKRFKDLHHEFAMPTAEYNRLSVDHVEVVTRSLAKSVYESLHPE